MVYDFGVVVGDVLYMCLLLFYINVFNSFF